MTSFKYLPWTVLVPLLLVQLAACGGSEHTNEPPPPSAAHYSVGGTVSGLDSGKSLMLKNNDANNLMVLGNGTFTFSTALVQGAAYAVTVATAPGGQSCVVSNGAGSIHSVNVTNVSINCSSNIAVWQNFTLGKTAAGKATLTLFAKEELLVNAPFLGIEVRKNNVDITDDIVNIEPLSATSWRYTFDTQALDTPGATLNVSLKNSALANPGHYVAARSYGTAGSVQGTYQLLVNCQAGVADCASQGALPGLLAAVKGISRRYEPRDIETSQGVYDFSAVFNDAAFLASKDMKLHVMFTFKSFAKNTLYNGTDSQVAFNIPRAADGMSGWDGVREREIHVYVSNKLGVWTAAPFQFNSARTQVILDSAPPAGAKNVNVVYARDPFPEYAWQMNPPIGGWYEGVGGQNNDAAAGGGSHGHIYAPWRTNTVTWLRNFMNAFEVQWNNAIAKGLSSTAIESVSIQETANAMGDAAQPSYDPTYTVAGYRAGLLELAKFTARAVRGKALFGQLFNIIPGGNKDKAMAGHSNDIILWGARLEGPDLFNNEKELETNVYENVHRALHAKALTMIWHQNASYSEPVVKGSKGGSFYTPVQQYGKAQRGVTDNSTASGTPGLGSAYVFWNLTTIAPGGSPLTWLDALPVIASNPIIQTVDNNRYLWRRAIDSTPISDQTLTQKNP